MEPPPWVIGQLHTSASATNHMPQSCDPPSLIASPQSTGSESSSGSPLSIISNHARVVLKENTALSLTDPSSLISPQAVVLTNIQRC